jgi:DNA-binding response OmpR family regulator
MTSGGALRVLVVDDEALVAMLLGDMLEDLGFEVVGPAMDLTAAMTLAREADLDGAVLDISLDGRPSFPVAQILRDRQIPFVFASGYGAAEAGSGFEAVTVIQKPFNLAELNIALRVLDEA